MTVPLIERFRDRLPVTAATPVVSLGEGSTPLLAAPRLARAAGIAELWLKWEASNPTGSYKDRGMTVAVSKAVEEGAAAVLCASTGNTAASSAAYAARAGIPAVVLTPQGAVAGAKLAQTRMLGATVLEVEGDFDQALAAAQELADRGSHVLVNSLNPHRRAGQKTAVFEIVEELGGAPDVFVLPYGGGGNTVSYAAGLAELGLETPLVSVEALDRRRTLASAIRIGDPVHAARVDETGARVVAVADEEIVEAWRRLAAEEGLFCEPSSAAGLVPLLRGDLEGDRVVVTITGHGLKDPVAADERGGEVVRVALELAARLEQLLGVAVRPRGREAERDRRRRRAEPALERDPVREAKLLADRVGEERVRPDREVRRVLGQLSRARTLDHHAGALRQLELVPEVERDGSAVEPGAEVGRGGGRANDHRLAAAAIASASGSTCTGGGAMRSAIAGSLSPCPVIVTTRRSPSTSPRSTAASPAADDGSQKRPSSAASLRQVVRSSSSVAETTRAPEAATASACTGSPMRIAVARVSRRRVASTETIGVVRPSSRSACAYDDVLPPPP